jgi:hypothetical protein
MSALALVSRTFRTKCLDSITDMLTDEIENVRYAKRALHKQKRALYDPEKRPAGTHDALRYAKRALKTRKRALYDPQKESC